MSVYKAISAVAKEMAEKGISKDRKNQQQGFQFRGIDQVYNALAPALVRHGLLILPRIVDRTVTERVTQKGGLLFYVVVKAEFDFVGVDDGSIHTVTTYGEAMDSGDKATNKAMSIAYKYAAFQTFCIPTEETAVDADSQVHHPMAMNPRKGSEVYLEGKLQTRKWQDQSGNDRYTTEIRVGINGTMQMLGGKQDGNAAPSAGQSGRARGV